MNSRKFSLDALTDSVERSSKARSSGASGNRASGGGAATAGAGAGNQRITSRDSDTFSERPTLPSFRYTQSMVSYNTVNDSVMDFQDAMSVSSETDANRGNSPAVAIKPVVAPDRIQSAPIGTSYNAAKTSVTLA